MADRIAVTIVTGSMGANGAHFLERVLHDVGSKRVTAILPEEQVAQTPVRGSSPGVSWVTTTAKLERLGQGCACCTVRYDLMRTIKEIAANQSAEHVVLALPAEDDLYIVGKTFSVPDRDGTELRDVAFVKTVVTIVDGPNLLANLQGESAYALLDRVRVASVIGIDKASTLTAESYREVVKAVHSINPNTRFLRDDENDINLDMLSEQAPARVQEAGYCTPQNLQ